MVRLFLDSNVLFSAAYRPHAGLLELWKRKETVLCSSHYAVAEAKANLDDEAQRSRLATLAEEVQLFNAAEQDLPRGIVLPEKGVPIVLAAIEARATHLLTGDVRHFGRYFGKRIAGIIVLPPGEYLRASKGND